MSHWLTCARGHRWDWTGDDDPAIAGPVACPLCGALGAPAEPAPTDPNVTIPSVDPNATLPSASPIFPPAPPLRADRSLPQLPGYQVLERIGGGGMGVVYKARQVVTNRLVAVKMIADGLGDLSIRARFRAEAEAAARLRHPGVVQIYEVGDADGRPFLALEFCEGGSLADRLDGAPLPPDRAAAVTEQLARAMHAGHRAGIVHRDLKPSNVLLQRTEDRSQRSEVGSRKSEVRSQKSDDGVAPVSTSSDLRPLPSNLCLLTSDLCPKIADFGLARLMDTDSGQTHSGMILGTPSYMAPEQAAGDNKSVGPASDVYALGAVLYELLTGAPPFRGTTLRDTIEQVLTRDPVPPRRLQPKVPLDLETVCLKCLRKEPANRYPSAEALAEDLRAFTEGRPVWARPVSWHEHVRKWARRRPGLARLTAALIAAVFVAIGVLVWSYFEKISQGKRREALLNQTVESVQMFLTEVAEEDLDGVPRMTQKRRVLLERALAIYQNLLASEDSPLVREQAARAYRRVGDIRRQLGHNDEALAAYARATADLEAMIAEQPNRSDLVRELADCHNFAGEVYRLTARPEQAAAAYRRALELQQALHAADPTARTYRQDLARSHYNLGIVAKDRGQGAEAKGELTEAVRLSEELSATDPTDPKPRHHLARARLNLGSVLRQTDGAAAARPVLERAVELFTQLREMDPRRPDYRRELAVCLNNLGNVHRDANRLGDAQTALGHAHDDLLRGLVNEYPDVPEYRVELANVCNTLAAIYAESNRPDEADRYWRAAEDHLRRLVKEQPEASGHRGVLGAVLGNRGSLQMEQGRPAEARPLLEAAVTELVAALKPNPGRPDFRATLRDQCRHLADVLTGLGDHEAVRRHARSLAADLPADGFGTYRAAC
ncbi:MAG TPA: protein kinase, partial [Fimbriiglobus sp.]|nr:protein kinase [Fimbriiglobus sp.]